MKKSIKYLTLLLCMFLLASCSPKSNDGESSEVSAVQNETSMSSELSSISEDVSTSVDSSEEKTLTNNSDAIQRVGSDEFGYVSIPSDFVKFKDIAYPDSSDIQYSDISTTNIVTMNKIDLSEVPKEELKNLSESVMAQNIAYSIKNEYGDKVKNIDEKSGSFNDMTYHSAIIDFDDGAILIVNILKYNDNYYYLAVEGRNSFTDTNEDIVKSFSLEK